MTFESRRSAHRSRFTSPVIGLWTMPTAAPVASIVLLALLSAPLSARARPQQEPQLQITTARPSSPPEVGAAPSKEQVAALRSRLALVHKAMAGLGGASIDRRSLTHELERLEGLLSSRRPPCNPAAEVKRLERDLALVAAGESPRFKPGLRRLSYRSPLDKRLHPFVVYVPHGYTPKRRYPLIVMLHGMRSSPMRAVGRLFGVADEDLTDSKVVCDRPQVGQQPVLVVAPNGFGDSLFRGPGARDVERVVQLMNRLYSVDRRRVTITGLSMGGTGAVELALQRPHIYAGVLALCGYYDRRLDRSSAGQPILSWERHLMTVHSPVDWAENGREIPLVLIHGTRDGPGRARSLERRYKQLGYSVKLELYNTGHEVWAPGYKDGRAFGILSKLRKGPTPRRVTFVTSRSRVRRSHWVTIRRFVDHRQWARVEARIVDTTHVEVTTKNVEALRLDLPAAYLDRAAQIQVRADGSEVVLPPSSARWTRRVDLERQGKSWAQEQPKKASASLGGPLRKRPGLSGPIEEIYNDPIVVVYGTRGGQRGLLRSVAKKLASYNKHVSLSYPVVADRRFPPRRARGRSVILVGNEQTNIVLARIGAKLPIRVTTAGVRLGSREIRRPDIGATFIYPNPEAPRWYVRVVGGTTARSYKKLFKSLPRYLPDYLVFDEGIARRGRFRPVVGSDRSLVAAGYFDEQWRLP